MESLVPFLALPVLVVAFAVLTNLYREHRRFLFDLKPNCLLTRKPVVFLTGPRTLFYFRKYWNAYPEILAEHGYAVFTVHLPWRGPWREKRLQEFLKHQTDLQKKFHFICDSYTRQELAVLLETSPAVASVTVLSASERINRAPRPQSRLLELAYRLHTRILSSRTLPSAADLGVDSPNARDWLLQKMQEKAEDDFLH